MFITNTCWELGSEHWTSALEEIFGDHGHQDEGHLQSVTLCPPGADIKWRGVKEEVRAGQGIIFYWSNFCWSRKYMCAGKYKKKMRCPDLTKLLIAHQGKTLLYQEWLIKPTVCRTIHYLKPVYYFLKTVFSGKPSNVLRTVLCH